MWLKNKSEKNALIGIIIICLFFIVLSLRTCYIGSLKENFTYSIKLRNAYNNGLKINYFYSVDNIEYDNFRMQDSREVYDFEALYLVAFTKEYKGSSALLIEYKIPDSLIIPCPKEGWSENPYFIEKEETDSGVVSIVKLKEKHSTGSSL